MPGQLVAALFYDLTRAGNFRWRAERGQFTEYAVDADGEALTHLPDPEQLIGWQPITGLPPRHWSDPRMGIVVR